MRKVNKKIKSQDRLIKTILVFILYFVYSQVFKNIFGNMAGTNFIADLVFLIGIVFAYKDNLKEDFKDLKKNYKFKKILKTVLIWVFIIFISNILMGALTEMISPNAALDDNTQAIWDLYAIDAIYTIFKTMIFAVLAEEILFRESVHDVIKNKWLFIIISSVIYTIINFIYTGFGGDLILVSILSYFIPSLILSYAYYKNNSNIIVLMLIKFIYQLIPLTILLLGL